jgi:maltooligosyltrehalose trehalohydrolase
VPDGLVSLGASPLRGGQTRFRAWAPRASRVDVVLGGAPHALARAAADGVHEGVLRAGPGDTYTLSLDGREPVPDPFSRSQPLGLRGPSCVVDTTPFRERATRRPVPLADLVVYELHVGSFTSEGTLDAAAARLPAVAALGVTAVQVMPVATFAGTRGWGYDGVYGYAVHPVYGGPEALARFVRCAHDCGLAVLLDVVVNHVGPGGEGFAAFGPWFRSDATPWGPAPDFRVAPVREWAIGIAEQWVRDFGVDGLRLDAVFAVRDDGPRHVLADLAARVRAIEPRTLLVGEMGAHDMRPVREWGHDAVTVDDLHHALHAALTGERDGHYARFGRASQIAEALAYPEGERIVVCAQNHDQVGNRALGDRLPPRLLRAASAVTLLSPFTPQLFMGEEHAETRPFPYFTDHDDPVVAARVREGRRREHAGFGGASVPDPQDAATARAAVLEPAAGDAGHRAFVSWLLRLRRELPARLEVAADDAARTLVLRRGPVTVRLDLATAGLEVVA